MIDHVEQLLLEKCPPDYYSNCLNCLIKCKQCCAGTSEPTSKNFYKPLEDIGLHPFKQQRKKAKTIDKEKSLLIKRALKTEAITANRIARKTIGSGRVYGDGDLVVLNNFRVEHKLRTTTKSYSVSAAEYEKGKRQGVGIYAIAVDKGDTCYFLTEDTFTELLSLAKKGLEASE